MALLMEYYQEQFELTIPNCYWKVEIDNGINGGKTKLHVRMNCFKNQAIADTNQGKYADYDFEFAPDLTAGADNFLAQAYTVAKTLPKFATAVDA